MIAESDLNESLMSNTSRNASTSVHIDFSNHDDATWILTSAFIIFTMQSGFGLLESGSVSAKNEVNIMVKNAVDVIFGGLTFWMFGYGIVFGDTVPMSNGFCGWGSFFVTSHSVDVGWVYSKFFFTASFSTTATTIVSGAMAERTKFESYILFSLVNTFIFSFPAHWMWADNGWLSVMGAIDVAGAGPVHIVGGMTALTATLILGPRKDRFQSHDTPPPFGSPTNAILGMFMLWWGWLGFNCGSTFGISGSKWILAARSAVSTITASTAGGMTGLFLSYIFKKRKFHIDYLINSVLASLVSITALCALASPAEGLAIGMVGAVFACLGVEVLTKLQIDDPVSCVSVHAISGAWSLLSVGIFSRKDIFIHTDNRFNINDGLLWGGNGEQLKVQLIAIVSIAAWSVVVSFIFLKLVTLTIGLRVSEEEEILGADVVEHNCGDITYDKKKKKLVRHDESPENENDPPLRTLSENSSLPGRRATSRRCSRMLGSRFYMTSKHYPLFNNEDKLEETSKRQSPGCRQKTFVEKFQQFHQIGQSNSSRRGSALSVSKYQSTQTLTVGNIDCDPYISERGTAAFTIDNELTHRNSWRTHQNQATEHRDSCEESSIYQNYTNPLFKSPVRISYL